MRLRGLVAVVLIRTMLCMTQLTTTQQKITTNQPLLVWSPGLAQRPASPVSRLIKEWQLMSDRNRELEIVNSWSLPGSKVTHLDEVLVRAGFNTARDDSQGDQYLWLLVKQATSDELAARIVLQRILPPLLAIARRRGRIVDGGVDSAIADILPSAWGVIRKYPWHRRPNKVASNLVRDSEYFAFVHGNRSKRYKVIPMDPSVLCEFVAAPEQELEQEISLDQLIAVALEQGIDPKHIEILRAVASGDSATIIAARYGVAERTARAWRAKAISELRVRTRCAV
ncbi:hypothetical protein LBMAG16_01130 [Actinomycetes bacterium]|nr:hypothetical protein LBMAG16_01130 [Actinomycetes bacterium]